MSYVESQKVKQRRLKKFLKNQAQANTVTPDIAQSHTKAGDSNLVKGLLKEALHCQSIKQGALAQSAVLMPVTPVKSQGKPIARKVYAPYMPDMRALPIVNGVKILPKIKRQPVLAKVDSDYKAPRFSAVKRKQKTFKRWGEE